MNEYINYELLPILVPSIGLGLVSILFIIYYITVNKHTSLTNERIEQLKDENDNLRGVSLTIVKHDADLISLSNALITINKELQLDIITLESEKSRLLKKIDFNLKCSYENELVLRNEINKLKGKLNSKKKKV